MHAVQWQVLVEQCSQLSQRQRLAGMALAQGAVIALIEQTVQASLHCPA